MKRTLLVVTLLAFAGCSSTSFVGKRFDNFTAYYNTFYNARKAYGDAAKALKPPDRAIDRSTYLYVFDPGSQGAGTKDFENAIKKSADVLRGHPDSKWVDDALLLIGKSYYYMGNTVGAQQKFREVIDRQSGLENEARFWLGLALMASGSLDEAATHYQESLEREKTPRKWTSRMRLALGELYVRQERWAEAAEQLEAGTKRVGDDELGSRGQFLLGQVLETIDEYDRAAKAYRDVSRFKPAYELSYAAKFSAVRVEGEHGDPDVALQALRKMERDDKNFAYRGELAYLRGRVLQAAGRADEAIGTFYDVLYNSDVNLSTIRGPVHYHLGLLFRDQFVDFELAAAHFDTAATALGRNQRPNTPGRTQSLALAPYAITDASDLADVFGRFAEFRADVGHYDSLLTLGQLDDEAFSERIEEIRVQRAAELIEERRSQERQAAEASFRRGGALKSGRPGASSAAGGADYAAAGFLYHRDRSRVQEGLLSFFDRWGERPHVPDWRRSAAIAGARAGDPNEGEGAAEGLAQEVSGNLATEALVGSVDIDISDIPRTAEKQAEMRRVRAEARYELGNVLFLSIGMPDSAAAWYRQVLDEADDPDIAARALYALAEIQHSLGDRESAAAIYRRVLDEHPDSEVASRAAQRLGVADEAPDRLPEVMTDLYQKAFDRWVDGSFPEAMGDMLALAAAYPDSLVSGRALLAAAAVYVDWSDANGRDILDPIGVPIPDSVWVRLDLIQPPASPLPDSVMLADTVGTVVGPVDAPTDSVLVAVADSARAHAQPDSLTAVVDSLASALATGVDSTGAVSAPPATAREAVNDTLRQSSGDRAGDEEDVSVAEEPAVYLVDLYNLVKKRYPGSSYARRAAELVVAIEERNATTQDSVAAVSGQPTTGGAIPGPDAVTAADDVAPLPAEDGAPAAGAPARPKPELEDEIAAGGRTARLRGDDAEPREPASRDTTVYEAADVSPILVGGEGALGRMFRYPDTAAEGRVSGSVGLRFVVDQRGRVVDPEVVKSVGAGCDEEALRVIRLARFRPATIERLPVRLRMSMEVECAPRSGP